MTLPTGQPRSQLGRTPLQRLGIALYIALNLAVTVHAITGFPHGPDWATLSQVPQAIASGEPYAVTSPVPFVWSPIAAYLLIPIVALGYWVWFAAHVAAVALLRSPLLILLTVTSWAFWTDAAGGNIFTFVFVSAVLAFRGNTMAVFAFAALFLLAPRPLMVPLLALLIWQRPELRLRLLGLFIVGVVLVAGSGYAVDWLNAAASYASTTAYDIGLTRLVGLWWMLAGIPAAVLLTVRWRPGLAGLLVAPYLLPQYLLLPLVDLEAQVARARRKA